MGRRKSTEGKQKMKKFLLVMIAGMLPLIQAAALEFQLKNGKDMPVYKCGEPAEFTLSVTDEGKPVDTGRYVAEITLDGNKIIEKKELDLAKGNPAKFTGTLKIPGFILVRLRDANNKIVMKTVGLWCWLVRHSNRKRSAWAMLFQKISWSSGKPDAKLSQGNRSSWKKSIK